MLHGTWQRPWSQVLWQCLGTCLYGGLVGETLQAPIKMCPFLKKYIVDEKSIKTGLSLRVFEIEFAGNVTRTVTTQWLVDSKLRGLPETGMRRHLFFRIGMVFGIWYDFQFPDLSQIIWHFDTIIRKNCTVCHFVCKIFEFFKTSFWFFLHALIFQSSGEGVSRFGSLQSVDETDGMLGFQQLSKTTNVACGVFTVIFSGGTLGSQSIWEFTRQGVFRLLSDSSGWWMPQECTAKPLFPDAFEGSWLSSLRLSWVRQEISWKNQGGCGSQNFDLSCCYKNKVEFMVGAISHDLPI